MSVITRNGVVVDVGNNPSNIGISVGGQPNIGIAVGTTGPAGPAGPAGAAGPAGPMGMLNVVELTFPEFQALPTKQPNTIYVIT